MNMKLRPEIKKFKPYTNGVRHRQDVLSHEVTYFGEPKKSLTTYLKRAFGISNTGRRTQRGIQRGAKHFYRLIDFKRDKFNIPGQVVRVERDPNRSANIALIKYADGEYRYITCPKNLVVGSSIISSEKTLIDVGNAMFLKHIPVGNLVHNVELNKGEGAKLIRSAGSSAKILMHLPEKKLVKLTMPSGEIRLIHDECLAVIGEVGNQIHSSRVVGKAGTNRHMGFRPIVRGSAMNPCDHPHGGGEGRTSIGRNPVNKNGKRIGKITRSNRKFNKKMIIKRARIVKLEKK